MGNVVVKPYMIIPPEIQTPQTVFGQGEKLDFELLLLEMQRNMFQQ